MCGPLLEPYALGDLNLPNRIVLAPLARCRAGAARIPNELMAAYYGQRTSAGLMISEATAISRHANAFGESPGIYTDEMAGGWKRVTDAVHAKGGRMFLQLWHPGRVSHSSLNEGVLPVAPSGLRIDRAHLVTPTGLQAVDAFIETPSGKQPYEVPHELDGPEIMQIVEDYRKAASRGKAAGFDGVEVHAAHGYLIDSFLQSKTNHRTDDYGGSMERRYRFLEQVLEGVRSVWPAHRIGVNLSPNGIYHDMGSTDYRAQFLFTARQLDGLGLAYLHVVDGLDIGFHGLGEPMTLAEFRAMFSGPLIGNCGYTKETADKTIHDGLADLISFGRPFIGNPDLVERFKNGWPLVESAPQYWFAPMGEKGYTDYGTYSGK
jgi:N-ethylmaleimide reductase